jgi:hypothetical protein
MSHAAHARAPQPFELEFDLRPACLRIQSGARDDELLDFIARCCCRLGADRGGSAGVALTATATMAAKNLTPALAGQPTARAKRARSCQCDATNGSFVPPRLRYPPPGSGGLLPTGRRPLRATACCQQECCVPTLQR